MFRRILQEICFPKEINIQLVSFYNSLYILPIPYLAEKIIKTNLVIQVNEVDTQAHEG